MSSTDPDFGQALQEFKRGGWVVSMLGLGGAVARWLVSDENSTIMRLVKKSIAGAIVGVISFFVLWGQEIPGIYKALIMCTSGAMAPEIFTILKERYESYGKKQKRRGR